MDSIAHSIYSQHGAYFPVLDSIKILIRCKLRFWGHSPKTMISEQDQEPPLVARCVGVLRDDYLRQGNHLSFDDFNRIVSRLHLQRGEKLEVLLRLSSNGIDIVDSEKEFANDEIGETYGDISTKD